MSIKKDQEMTQVPSKEVFFHDREVVITGGASGIGRALAENLLRLGANVSVIDITSTKDQPEKITFVQADVTDKSTLKSKVQAKKIDLLIIAAGVTSETNEPTQQEKDVMEAVNVIGVANTLEVFDSRLTPHAQVVYIGSDNPPKAYYANTKKKGAQLIKAFAPSHSDCDIKTILLGPVKTPLFEKGKSPEVIQRIAENVGLYEPEEFANELIEKLIESSQHHDLPQEIVMYKKIW